MFKNCVDNYIFPDIWKKSNIIPFHKTADKPIIDNYRPVSHSPICRKKIKKIAIQHQNFNSVFKFLDDNNLLSFNQSGFRLSDSIGLDICA